MNTVLPLDIRALDRARISRDPRFDGKFFIAVTSTKIYCRPICPVRSPKKANIRYYFSAAAAAEAGYRPCLRCRPEAAPGTPAWLGTSALVRRALRLIDDGILDETSVSNLADKLGVGPRHLHRLFIQHVGASPITLAQTRRLHFAKRLLDETNLPITEIALAAGFGSLRRFNSVFQQTYQRAPRELRRQMRANQAPDTAGVVLKLAYRPPYDFAQVLGFLRARAVPGVEQVKDEQYSRTVRIEDHEAIIAVRKLDGEDALELRVPGAVPADLFKISAAARRMFDVAADPARTVLAFQSDSLLGPLVKRSPGLRIPGALDAFECAVRAIVGQQVSVAGARTLLTRLAERFGRKLKSPSGGLTHCFPTATEVASADLAGLGLTTARVRSIKELARGVAEGQISFDGSVEEVVEQLAALPGIGNWTAQYVAMRALGEPDAFPGSDLVLRRMIAASVAGNSGVMSEKAVEARAEDWRPWRSYAAMHLWHAAATTKKLAAAV